jgi:hypothetical protein
MLVRQIDLVEDAHSSESKSIPRKPIAGITHVWTPKR